MNFRFYAECRPSARPYQISRLPSPHMDSLYKEAEQNFWKKKKKS